MATILPFGAIRPNPNYIDQLIQCKAQAESVAGKGLLPLKQLLETPARIRPETQEGQEAAYSWINATLNALFMNDQLIKEPEPRIFIYEVSNPSHSQTGVWALTSLVDMPSIKTHELTFPDSVRRLRNYREHTGLEGSPVLLTYTPDAAVNRLIQHVKASETHTTMGNSQGIHRLWKITDIALQKQLTEAFERIGTIYLADGHHRVESAMQLLPRYNTLSSLYMATDQLQFQPYDRIVVPYRPISKSIFLQQLAGDFEISKNWDNLPVRPERSRHFGLFIENTWYHLIFRGTARQTDAALVQEKIFAPLFGITDSQNDPRLTCTGGQQAMAELLAFAALNPGAVCFTLCPLTAEQLMDASDRGENLPPKSTWIDPKVPYGLLLYRHT